MNDETDTEARATDSSFRLSTSPVVLPEIGVADLRAEFFPDLPSSYVEPIVFAMPRDPRTLFVYWDIDWPQAFSAAAPSERKVYLRIYDDSGSALNEIAVEPMAKSCTVNVPTAGGSFQVDLGFYNENQAWHSVGTSELVQTPPEKVGELSPGDFALVPFHITFQRLTELFRATHIDEGSLVQSLTRLQEKSLRPEEFRSLAPEEKEIYRAMKASISERNYLPRGPFDRASEMRLQKKLERVLGFGVRPSSSSLGGSSLGV